MSKLIAKYWGKVSQVDQSVGKILDKLKALGLDDNTIVVFTSDHGDMMGAHLMVEKQVMFEEAVRVPFLLKIPFLKNEHKIIKQRVSQIDIVPTLIDLMGGICSGHLQGKNLVPLIKGEKVKDDYIFIEWNPDKNFRNNISKNTRMAPEDAIKLVGTSSSRAVISPDGRKLCLSDKDKNQLFDLNSDSLETTNLFYNHRYTDKINDLSEKIRKWQIQTGDKIVISPNLK